MHLSGNAAALVAVLGIVLGTAGLAVALIASTRVRRLREAQRTLVGGGRKDLVEFAVSLQARIDDLHRAVDEVAGGVARVDRRVDESLANAGSRGRA